MGTLLRRARRFLQRRWGCKEYVVIFKSLAGLSPDAEHLAGLVRFFVATPQDIPWMSPKLGPWATWCNGGKPTPDAAPILREQFADGDLTIVGVEDKPDGDPVFMLILSGGGFSSSLLGEAFRPGRHVVSRRGWVAPDHRGRGIATAGIAFAHAQAVRRGIDGLWGFILTGNAASLSLHSKLGYEELGRARIVTRLKRRYAGIRLDQAGPWRLKRVPFSISSL